MWIKDTHEIRTQTNIVDLTRLWNPYPRCLFDQALTIRQRPANCFPLLSRCELVWPREKTFCIQNTTVCMKSPCTWNDLSSCDTTISRESCCLPEFIRHTRNRTEQFWGDSQRILTTLFERGNDRAAWCPKFELICLFHRHSIPTNFDQGVTRPKGHESWDQGTHNRVSFCPFTTRHSAVQLWARMPTQLDWTHQGLKPRRVLTPIWAWISTCVEHWSLTLLLTCATEPMLLATQNQRNIAGGMDLTQTYNSQKQLSVRTLGRNASARVLRRQDSQNIEVCQ